MRRRRRQSSDARPKSKHRLQKKLSQRPNPQLQLMIPRKNQPKSPPKADPPRAERMKWPSRSKRIMRTLILRISPFKLCIENRLNQSQLKRIVRFAKRTGCRIIKITRSLENMSVNAARLLAGLDPAFVQNTSEI